MSTPTDPPLSRRAARLAEQSAHGSSQEAFAQPVTRRGSGATPISVPSSAPTDVEYRTQVRPRVPHYDAPPGAHTVVPGTAGPDALVRGASAAPPPPVAPPPIAPPHLAPVPLASAPIAPPATEAPMRRRDFRPPAEQHTLPAPPAAGFAPPAAGFDTELEYRTQRTVRPDAPAEHSAPAPVVPTHVVAPVAPIEPVTPHEHTLSRRELRLLREQQGGAPAAETGEIAPLPSAAPAPLIEPAPVAMPTAGPSTVGSAPTGSHWSVGIHADDDPFENTFSREVGSTAAATSTNALVLPEMPTGSIAGPVSGTGEIIITGMIDLPRTVSSTGTVPTVHDSPDIDDLFDAGDLTPAPVDAAPVSASRAVSSHTQGHSVITPSSRRPSSNTVTTVLVAATVVMAVVAIGLFVLAAVNGLF